MAFELLTKTNTKGGIHASISKIGSIGITEVAKQQFDIIAGNATYAMLYYDRDSQQIGIAFSNKKQPNSTVVHYGQKTGLCLYAKSILEQNSLLPQITCLYDVKQDERTKMLIINLNTARVRGLKK